MLPNIGLMEMLIIFALALLIFGPKKLPEMGAAIGKSITSFRKGMKDVNKDMEEQDAIAERAAELKRIELEQLERDLAAKKAAATAEEVAKASHVTPDPVTVNAVPVTNTTATTESGKDDNKKI